MDFGTRDVSLTVVGIITLRVRVSAELSLSLPLGLTGVCVALILDSAPYNPWGGLAARQ